MSRSLLTIALAFLLTSTVSAGITKVRNLCTVAGQTELILRGQGLVAGLAGTGDPKGKGTTATSTAVTTFLRKSGLPAQQQDTSGYALVEITATVPKYGIERGQTLDCQVTAIGGASSLQGGRLIIAGLALPGDTSPGTNELIVSAIAEGSVNIATPLTPTTGSIPDGVVMQRTLATGTINDPTVVRLLINAPSADWGVAHNIQKAINDSFQLQGLIAKAQSKALIVVQVPEPYRNDYVQFVSELMNVSVLEAGSHPRVIIDDEEGIVLMTASTTITPVAFTHRNINVEIQEPFLGIQGDAGGASPQQLNDLLAALNELKVPTDDVIAIVRGLRQLGAIQAEVIDK